jgi:hypothetical protein
MSLTPKEQYAKMVCLFLAEGLRTRRIPLQNAAEIAGKFLQNINLLDTEQDFLSLVKELSKDFSELSVLEHQASRAIQISEKRRLEQQVREFAVQVIVTDPPRALSLLQDAARDDVSIETLCAKYPEFKSFSQSRDGRIPVA